MLKRIALILTALIAVSCAGSLKKVKITSFDFESISPCGLREMNAVISITVDNPSVKFSIDDLNAVLKYEGNECMVFEGSRIDVNAKSCEPYRVLVHGRLSDRFNPFVIFNLLRSKDLSQCRLDVEGTALAMGMKKKFSLKDIPVNDLLEKI